MDEYLFYVLDGAWPKLLEKLENDIKRIQDLDLQLSTALYTAEYTRNQYLSVINALVEGGQDKKDYPVVAPVVSALRYAQYDLPELTDEPAKPN